MGILENMRLDDKVAFVTGGTRGIGYSIALALAEAGANIALIDLEASAVQSSAQKIAKETGRKAFGFRADVTKKEELDAVVGKIVEDLGRLDIAVCNAGVCVNVPAEEMSLADWNKVISINLTGVFLSAQAAAQPMLKQGNGSIINIASMSGSVVNVPQPQCSYNASKAGVIQLTKSLAVEWASRNIRVNSISPGYIGTDLILKDENLKPLIEQWNALSPLRRIGRPEELQAIAVYLAGDASPFTTGGDFLIDGAYTCF